MNTLQKLVYMANQIARNFASQGDAAARTADHIARFWDPGMKAKVFKHVDEPEHGLDDVAAQAVRALRSATELSQVMAREELDR